jgi:hypothetical protein
MSWVDDALNTPEAAVTQFVKDELPKVDKMIIVWLDSDERIWYRASSMKCVESIGLLECAKALIQDYLWSDDEDAVSE